MIAIAVILALSAALIAGLRVYWQKIVKWIQKAVNKIKEVLGLTPNGTKTFISRTTEGFKNVSKYYIMEKTTEEWTELTRTRPVTDESEIPPDIREKAYGLGLGSEISTTEELKLALDA